MVRRRRLHKLFDAIACDFKQSVAQTFAGEKNLVIKECIVSLDQLSRLKFVHQRVEEYSAAIQKHFNQCKACA